MSTEVPILASFMDSHVVGGDGEPIALRDPREILARERIGLAVNRQLVMQSSDYFAGYGEDPLGTFSKGPLHVSVVDEMIPEIDRLYTAENIGVEAVDRYRERVMGKLMEDIGYGVLSQRSRKNGHVVISPEDTLHIVKALHPDVSIGLIGGVQRSIPGIWVPDGLVIDPKTNIIIEVLDYATTLGRKVRGDSLRNAHVSLTSTRIFKDARLVLVHPRQEIGSETQALINGTKTIELPFSSKDFKALGSEMFKQVLMRLGYIATDEDIVNRKNYQKGVFNALRSQGSSVMTPTYADYGKKHDLGESLAATEY